MTTIKPTNETVNTDYEGLEGLEGEADLFTAGQETYPTFMWANGLTRVKSVTEKKPIGVVIGWCAEAGKYGSAFDEAMEYLVAQWEGEEEAARAEKRDADESLYCEKVFLQHRSSDGKAGNTVEYFSLPVLEFFPLAYAMPSQSAVTYNDGSDPTKPSGRLGIARYWEDRRTDEGNWVQGSGRIKLLVVAKRLHEAGYQNDEGEPFPVMLTTRSTTGMRFAEVLDKHTQVIKWVRDTEKKQMPYFAISITSFPSDEGEVVENVKTKQSSTIYPICSNIPPKEKIDGLYTRSHYCGNKLLRPMKKLVDDVAIPWCVALVNWGIYTQVMSGRFKGVVPPTAKKFIEERNSTIMEGQAEGPSRGGAKVPEEETEYITNEQLQKMHSLIEFFAKQNREDLSESLSTLFVEYEGQESTIPYDIAFTALQGAMEQKRSIEKEQKGDQVKVSGRSRFSK